MPSEFESRFSDESVTVPDDVDEAALRRMELVAYVLDDGIRIPGVGYRVGLDPVVGVLPVAGDVAVAVVSLYLVAEAARQGVPPRTLLRMLVNVGVDASAGSVPLVGDLFDAAWKANKYNAELAVRDLAVEEAAVAESADAA